MKKIKSAKKKIELNLEAMRILVVDDLRQVCGGYEGPPSGFLDCQINSRPNRC